jgi:hypothetical protein
MDTFHSLHNGQQLDDAGKITCPPIPSDRSSWDRFVQLHLTELLHYITSTYLHLATWMDPRIAAAWSTKFPSSYLLDSPTNDIIMTCLLPSMSATALWTGCAHSFFFLLLPDPVESLLIRHLLASKLLQLSSSTPRVWSIVGSHKSPTQQQHFQPDFIRICQLDYIPASL